MHTVPASARRALLGALAALLVLAGALLVAAPKASAAYSDCAQGKVCIYQFAHGIGAIRVWDGNDTGCKTHEGLDPLSVYNHTSSRYVSFPGRQVTLVPGQIWDDTIRKVTGIFCITVSP